MKRPDCDNWTLTTVVLSLNLDLVEQNKLEIPFKDFHLSRLCLSGMHFQTFMRYLVVLICGREKCSISLLFLTIFPYHELRLVDRHFYRKFRIY